MAHYWGRLAQQHGHRVTLVPPAYVRPYVRRSKTDRADAEAILEAVRSGEMPSVPVKRREQQALVALHRVREQWMTTRCRRGSIPCAGSCASTASCCRQRPRGAPGGADDPGRCRDRAAAAPARRPHQRARREIRAIEERIAQLETELRTLAEGDPVVTPAANHPRHRVVDGHGARGQCRAHPRVSPRAAVFTSGLGLTPREHSSGHRRRLGAISKQGDVYLRCLLTHGARSVLLMAHRRAARGQSLTRLHHWALALRARRGHNKATIAIANKLGRIVWAVWQKDVPFAMPDAA